MGKNKKVYRFFIMMVFVLFVVASCSKRSEGEGDKIVSQDTLNNGTNQEEVNDQEQRNKDVSEETNAEDMDKEESKGLNLNVKKLEKEGLSSKEEVRPIRDISSLELVSELRIGWNLGNTMDATSSSSLNSETSWGNPKTTKEMIDLAKDAGFNILRIPTSWGKHLGDAPDYTIDPAWMNRVKEVVDYGIDNDMYVILNLHHEEWHFPSNENYEKAKEILIAIWTQIAEYFDYYDEHLIFEGMNEPRMKGTSYEWNGGTPEGREVVSKLNLDFVDTIRKSSGNNNKRHLMIPTYAASSDMKTWNDLIIPEDDKIIVSLHAYTPYNFALNANGTKEWSIDNQNDTREIDSLMTNINKKFTGKGIPVILGEFGARNKDNLESRVNWTRYYVMKAKEIGVPCIWWDNGAFDGSGENFGLMNRRDLVWKFPEILDALMEGIE